MTWTLPWFPPAPASGPASILSLPPDDWVMQPKIDGIRVIIYRGQPFNRLGQPLSESKGAAYLRTMFTGLEVTLDGEWAATQQKYHAFDLPDEPGDLDHRTKSLLASMSWNIPGLSIVASYDTHFAHVYATLTRASVEGVVFKRRSSLYRKQRRASMETWDCLKRRFGWD